MNWKIVEPQNAETARFEMPQKAKIAPKYEKNDASALFFERTDKNVGLHQNALENVGPTAPSLKRPKRAVRFYLLYSGSSGA